MIPTQPELPLKPNVERCAHRHCFVSMAYVPAGDVCCDCGLLISQSIPQSPERLGYLSADWAWKHKHGKEWTTQEVLPA